MNDLGVYIHVPFCRHECPYCDFYKMELRSRPAGARLEFPELISRELELFVATHPGIAERTLSTVYFGGGTPSTLSPKGVAPLLTAIRSQFHADQQCELTLEANPENLTGPRADAWRAAGFNRLSVGIQSFDAAELSLLEREHRPGTIDAAVRNARSAGFTNLSLDLMFALPGQTLERWIANLRQALALEPEHISFYGLTWHEGTPFHRRLAARELAVADEGLEAEMYLAGCALLAEAGFEHYEVSNLARPGFRSRHNQRYWNRADVLALGPGAHGNLGSTRFHNPPDLDAWRASILAGKLFHEHEAPTDPIILQQERLYTLLRCRSGIDAQMDGKLYAAFVLWASRQPSAAAPWYTLTEDRAALTEEGWLICDSIVDGISGALASLPETEA